MVMKRGKREVLFSSFLLCLTFVSARSESVSSLEKELSDYSIIVTIAALIIIAFFVSLFLFYSKELKKYKKIIFYLIIIPIIVSSIYLLGSTIYVNLISDTKGPVHWHADFEVWRCGEKLDLVDPQGFSNKVGSALFHEHNDNRIHVEGVVIDTTAVGLDEFFDVVGGSLFEDRFSFPTQEGIAEVQNGDVCDGEPGMMQVFLYRVINSEGNKKSGFVYAQEKLNDFEDYVPAPYALVLPGDCIIVEFGEEKEQTDHLCESYRIAKEKGDLNGR